jgi:MFS family permease
MQDKWKITAVICAIGALNYGDRAGIISVFPLLRADLGLSDIMLAAVGSVFLWTYAVSSPFAGFLADRISRTKMLLTGLVVWSIVMALTGLVHSTAALLTMRALLGIAECTYLPAALSLIADHHGPKTRATAMALQLASLSIGLVVFSSLAGYLGQHLGWRMDMFILGAAGLLLAVVAYFFLYDAPRLDATESAPVDWKNVLQLLRMPAYLSVIAAAMLTAIAFWVLLNWLPLYFYERFHMSLAMASLSGSSTLQIASVVGALLGGYLSDLQAKGSPRRRLLLLMIGYFCAAPFLSVFLFKSSLGMINVSIILYSLIRSISTAGESPVIYELVGSRLSSSAFGILNLVNCVAGGLGILWAGFLKRDYGLDVAFGSLTGTATLAGVAILIGYLPLVRSGKEALPHADVELTIREESHL